MSLATPPAPATDSPVESAELSSPPVSPKELRETPAAAEPAQRLVSLDALRGFTMFWILGAGSFEYAIKEFPKNPVTNFIFNQLSHVKWDGVHFEDLIFPTFVFAAGVSIVLTLPRKIAAEGRGRTLWRIALRAATLFMLGIFFNGGASRGVDGIRWLGVLQRIAIAYWGAASLFVFLKPRGLIVALIALLVGYWALLIEYPVPGYGPGDFAEKHNLTNYLDTVYLGGKKYDGDHDPEGLLSSFPAIATCLFGVLAGIRLKRAQPGKERGFEFVVAGALLVALGSVWGLEFPVIKKIWTSSFVLVAAGWSALAFGVFYLVIDVKQKRKWAMPFVWIGMNPIVLYLLDNLCPVRNIAARLVGGDFANDLNLFILPGFGDFFEACVAAALSFWIAWFLYRRSIFIRV